MDKDVCGFDPPEVGYGTIVASSSSTKNMTNTATERNSGSTSELSDALSCVSC